MRTSDPLWAVAGLGLTFVAAAIQQLKIDLHAVYFDHNVLYHLVQGIGLWFLYYGLYRHARKQSLLHETAGHRSNSSLRN